MKSIVSGAGLGQLICLEQKWRSSGGGGLAMVTSMSAMGIRSWPTAVSNQANLWDQRIRSECSLVG